jgi:hypothetical protein
VKVGTVCIDTYEASVWQIPPANTSLVKVEQAGKATLAKLTAGSPSASCAMRWASMPAPLPPPCGRGPPRHLPGHVVPRW